MKTILLMIIALACGYLGAMILGKLKLPIPYMLGSMIAVAALSIWRPETYIPSVAKTVAQGVSGCFIGLSLSRKDLRGLKQLILPALVLLGCFLIFTAVMGLTLSYIFGIDKATAFLVAVPGGVTEMSLIAPDFGAVPSTVSFIQTFRLFTVYLIFPAMIAFFNKRVAKDEDIEALDLGDDEPSRETFLDKIVPDNMIIRQIITVIISIIGGFIGKWTGLPAGTLSFAMVASILFNLNCSKATLDRKYKKYAQLLSGALMGQTMTMEMVANIVNLLLPTAVLMAGYVIANLIISKLMSKTRKIDFISSMFASSPGGASDMALIAAELGGESPKIAILHIVRLLACYTIFPLWIKLLISILG